MVVCERKGGSFQNFESVNHTSKVDAKSDKRFLLFSEDISRQREETIRGNTVCQKVSPVLKFLNEKL